MPSARLCLAFIIAAAMGPAQAWDDLGHMTVAAIAYDRLTPEARMRAAVLLRLNPRYRDWRAVAKGADEERVAFLMASTWPDFIKHARDYDDDGEVPTGPDASRNLGYTDRLMHRYWHYVDLPFSPDNTPLAGPRAPNALMQIGVFRQALAQKSVEKTQAADE